MPTKAATATTPIYAGGQSPRHPVAWRTRARSKLRYVSGGRAAPWRRGRSRFARSRRAWRRRQRPLPGRASRSPGRGRTIDGDYVTVVDRPARRRAPIATTPIRAKAIRWRSPCRTTPGPMSCATFTGAEDRTLARASIAVEAVDAALEARRRSALAAWSGSTGPARTTTATTSPSVGGGAPEGTYWTTPIPARARRSRFGCPTRPEPMSCAPYLTGGSDRTLASAPLTVEAASATLDVPAVFKAGPALPWWAGPGRTTPATNIHHRRGRGPRGQLCRLRLYPATAPRSIFAAPEAPGAYEVRYVSGGGRFRRWRAWQSGGSLTSAHRFWPSRHRCAI